MTTTTPTTTRILTATALMMEVASRHAYVVEGCREQGMEKNQTIINMFRWWWLQQLQRWSCPDSCWTGWLMVAVSALRCFNSTAPLILVWYVFLNTIQNTDRTNWLYFFHCCSNHSKSNIFMSYNFSDGLDCDVSEAALFWHEQKASIPPLDFLTIHTTMQHKLATLVYRWINKKLI